MLHFKKDIEMQHEPKIIGHPSYAPKYFTLFKDDHRKMGMHPVKA